MHPSIRIEIIKTQEMSASMQNLHALVPVFLVLVPVLAPAPEVGAAGCSKKSLQAARPA